MYFINLNKLDIDKEYQYDTRLIHCEMPQNLADIQISDLAKEFKDQFELAIGDTQTNLPTDFRLELDAEGEATDEEIESFLSVANVALSALFAANIIVETGRQREYRLAVPEKLAVANVSLSLLKRAINHQCHFNIFNLHIIYKDLTFVLCDGKEEKDDTTTISSN